MRQLAEHLLRWPVLHQTCLALAVLVAGAAHAQDSSSGAETALTYRADYFSVVEGGLARKGAFLGIADAIVSLDAEKLWSIPGLKVMMHAFANHGDDPNEHVGSLQGIDNIAADENVKLYDAWVQWATSENTFSALVGLYDVNSEFDAKRYGAVFLHPSHGIGVDMSQAGANGPGIFPTAGLGTRLRVEAQGAYLQAAVLEGEAGDPRRVRGTRLRVSAEEGVLVAYEAGIAEEGDGERYGKVALGGWSFSEKTASLSSGKAAHNQGFYFLAERQLFAEEPGSSQGLGAYVRIGLADRRLNQTEKFFAGALNYNGPFPGRDADVFGIGIAVAENGDQYLALATNAAQRETAYEITYKAALRDWLNVQVDVQRVENPGTDPAIADATLVGMRTEFKF